MANKSETSKTNSILVPALLITGLAVYGIKEFLLPALSKPNYQPPIPAISAAGEAAAPQIIEKTIIVKDNDDPPPPPPDDNNDEEPPPPPPPPDPDPVTPVDETASDDSNAVMGILGNLFTEVIDKITPPENQQFYFSEQDVLNNERILIRRMSNANKGLCKLYTQWPAIKMKEEKIAKLYY